MTRVTLYKFPLLKSLKISTLWKSCIHFLLEHKISMELMELKVDILDMLGQKLRVRGAEILELC